MAWGKSGSTDTTNAWTKSRTSTSGGYQARPTVSSNPWSAALKEQYDTAKDTTSSYKADFSNAVAKAQGLSDKDYTSELRRFAGEDIDKEKTAQGNQLGALGMRELSLSKDVVDDWSTRRTNASSKAAISGQEMQLSALSALTSAISAASDAELKQIGVALEAATAGATADQNWTSMANSNYESDRTFEKTLADESLARKEAAEAETKQRNADELAAWKARVAADRARSANPAITSKYGPKAK